MGSSLSMMHGRSATVLHVRAIRSQRGSGYQCIEFKHPLAKTHQLSPTRDHGVFHVYAGDGVNPSD